MKTNKPYNRREKGKNGEISAIKYLKKLDYEILTHNFWSRQGEVDIIARKNEELHFIEVKTWEQYSVDNLEYSINKRKQRRIVETARYFLFRNKNLNGMSVKYDVIFIDRNLGKISYIRDAFSGDY